MATKRANGEVLLQYSKVFESTDPGKWSWRKSTHAVMSNGKILQKQDIRFEDGRPYSYGWKLAGKAKQGLDLLAAQEELRSKGYSIDVPVATEGGVPA